jgi:multiple sugar transport system ATP-binding protein
MAHVVLKDVCKIYKGGVRAVHNASLDIADREFVVFVGPSGCGKSTTLRMIAGLEEITSGTISIGEKVVNNVQPKDRDIAMVFQNYALYPHMTCFENMAFGLTLRGLSKAEIKTRVDEAARILSIGELMERRPKELSGGQQQRVAVGRAIVRKPAAFLFDEPLSNLDAKLRVDMRVEINKLHKRLSTTTIYVTHDQVEAMTLADRIVIMNQGEIQQVADPVSLYEQPFNKYVAGFIGSPPMNFLKGTLEGSGSAFKFVAGRTTVALPEAMSDRIRNHAGKDVLLGVRPEHLRDLPSARDWPDAPRIQAKVEVVEALGDHKAVHFSAENNTFIAKLPPHVELKAGDMTDLAIQAEKLHVFDTATSENLTCRAPRYAAPKVHSSVK